MSIEAKATQEVRMAFALHHYQKDSNPTHITNQIYVGSIGAAMSRRKLQEEGITHILTVADRITPFFPAEFTYKISPILDSPDENLLDILPECFKFIDEALTSGKLLVHW